MLCSQPVMSVIKRDENKGCGENVRHENMVQMVSQPNNPKSDSPKTVISNWSSQITK